MDAPAPAPRPSRFMPPHTPDLHSARSAPAFNLAGALVRQLAQCRDYLARHMKPLPEPYPGCLLFFSIASAQHAATVFHARGITLEAAWRESAIRIRHWAWSRQCDAVLLRIDWVEDITPMKDPGVFRRQWLRLPTGTAFGLADPGLEYPRLMHRHGQALDHQPATPALLLHLRSVYSEAGAAPTPLARPAPAAMLPCRHPAALTAAAPQPATPHAPAIHEPMRWSAAELLRHTQGRWLEPRRMPPAHACIGIDANRQHHLPDAAVIVRHGQQTPGVPAAAVAGLQAALLISSAPYALARARLPVLHVPDLPCGLRRLAAAARQRVTAPVIGVTGCVGKTSTLRMLGQCLLGSTTARADALLAQDVALQMVNWSDAAPCALAELPLHDITALLPLVMPDILIVTNLPAPGNPRHPHLLAMLQWLREGSAVVFDHRLEHQDCAHAAKKRGIRLITFGPHPQSRISERAYGNGTLHVMAGAQPLRLALQADGHHMALNAQAALAALAALEQPLEPACASLARWLPLARTGQPQRLRGGICLLDHSGSAEPLAMQAAFAQLQEHAPQPGQRLIVLGGAQAGCRQTPESARQALEPLLRATPSRRILLYGETLRMLADTLADLLHVNWYDDLNQLTESLLRTMHCGDAILLAGRATVNLAIVADAVRENTIT